MGSAPLRVVIVGGGASGTLLAAELMRQLAAVDLVVVEPRPELGLGLAYSTTVPVHRLNVRAGRMSGRADEPEHFLRWLRERDSAAAEGTFAPRATYGLYLRHVLDEAGRAAAPGSRLRHVRDRAVDVIPAGTESRIRLAEGSLVAADVVVLALGNLPSAAAIPERGDADPRRFVPDPWARRALDRIPLDEEVLLLGCGLTAVDVVLALRDRGHRGRILSVSRRGLLPRTQADTQPPLRLPTAGDLAPAPELLRGLDPLASLATRSSVRKLARALRAEAERLVATGGDWHPLFEALRPITPILWAGLPWSERGRFVRHLSPYWDAYRHRMAPEAGSAIRQAVADGTFEVRAARVRGFGADPRGVRVTLAPRGRPTTEEILVGRVVICTGPGGVETARHPLLRRLLSRRIVRPDPLGLGLDALLDGSLLAFDGTPRPGLFAIGPLLKGVLWETTAVPEIRMQAAALARRLASGEPSASGGLDSRLTIVGSPK